MAAMTIRGIDEGLKKQLRVQAALHGRSMEEEARDILRSVLFTRVPQEESLARAIRKHVEDLGGVELEMPERESIRKPPEF